MRVRRSQAGEAVVARVEAFQVNARELKTYDAAHPVWTDADPSVWAKPEVLIARLFPPEDATEESIRRVVAALRAAGVATKVMPRERSKVEPEAVADAVAARPEETVRAAVEAVVVEMSASVKLGRCTWDEVREMVDEQLGRSGL